MRGHDARSCHAVSWKQERLEGLRAGEMRSSLQDVLNIADALDLAVRHHRAGNLPEAEQLYRRILEEDPQQVDALHLLGLLAHQRGRHDVAVQHISAALRLRPDFAEAHNNLGLALKAQGRLDEAVAAYRQALHLNPGFAEAHNNMGAALVQRGKLEEAIAAYQQALCLKPEYAKAHNNIGNALRLQGRHEEAVAAFRQALRLQPGLAEVYSNLGVVLFDQGRLEEAAAAHQEALRLKPDYAEAYNNLGNALRWQARHEEAVAAYRQALHLKPDYAEAHSSLLFALHYRPGVTLAELAAAHAEYERQHAAPLRALWRPHANSPDPERCLRLGFLSPDLRCHPVGFFAIRCLENLDRAHAEAICYSNSLTSDQLTDRFRAAAAAWRNVFGWSDERLAEQVRADKIDILVDLAGHTAGNRLLVFARKPAPVQVTWIGYEGSTGLAAMDYILADISVIPEGAEEHYCERVLRLPDSYVSYDPPSAAPPEAAPPVLERGYATFGCCNNPAKITAPVIELWSRILHQVSGSRLVLKYRGMDDPASVRRFREGFGGRGIDEGRVELLGPSSHEEYLAHYQQLDVCLDPFPFCGGVTTCEALWMGVPVVTCPGPTFAGRHSLSYLSTLGLTELITSDPDEYVQVAVQLATDCTRLKRLRAGLRAQMAASPLCDGKRFAANLLAVLRGVWRRWVNDGACAERGA
jgi:protein O-GlcNAc transferase